ncbi:MAG TPA: hypothetical protein PLD47_06460 [Aggregatilineales bacterium]|nr:hypothetical protein [Anaerolineales bacterium]HRE47353.1 hypothetical protein [Aggregatilineales bacterium]
MAKPLWGALRVGLKVAILFALFNLLYVLVQPLSLLNRLTVYNLYVPGRARLPFSEFPAESYNLTLTTLDHMIASHEIARLKGADEFRVAHLGDSSVWGYLLKPSETQAACLTALQQKSADGRMIHVYNLGYPTLTVVKDLLILRRALNQQPDLILWSTSLASLYPGDQLDFPIIRGQYAEVARLIADYDFHFGEWATLTPPSVWDQTFFGQRRALADWLRYELYGVAWAGTGIDHTISKVVPPHPTSFPPDENVLSVNVISLQEAGRFSAEDLAWRVIQAGIDEAAARGVPVILVNEPIYRHPDHPTRYNTYYPRWAYDSYRETMTALAEKQGWRYADLWDAAPADHFTDTDFHLRVGANCAYAQEHLAPLIH